MKNKIDWQAVISGYDPDKETIKDYCARMHVSDSSYYMKRKEFRAAGIMPIEVEKPEQTTVEVNHVPIRYDATVTDEELKRLIRLCCEL